MIIDIPVIPPSNSKLGTKKSDNAIAINKEPIVMKKKG